VELPHADGGVRHVRQARRDRADELVVRELEEADSVRRGAGQPWTSPVRA